MEKIIFAAASCDKQKYYLDEGFSTLPEGIKEEIRQVCVTLADKLLCTFLMGFKEDGEIYFETIKSENVLDFDDIGAELEIKRVSKEKAELLKTLKLWYIVFKTSYGEQIKENLLKGTQN